MMRQLRANRALYATGTGQMQTQWISCTTRFPPDGAPLRFLLAGHSTSIHGTYRQGAFRSRWATYDAAHVSAWCSVDINAVNAAVAVTRTAADDASLTLLKQMARLFPPLHVALTDGSRSNAQFHSNQMSS